MDVIHLPIACPGIRHGLCPLLATTRPTKHLPKMLHREKESLLWLLHKAWCYQKPSLRLCAEAHPQKDANTEDTEPTGGKGC